RRGSGGLKGPLGRLSVEVSGVKRNPTKIMRDGTMEPLESIFPTLHRSIGFRRILTDVGLRFAQPNLRAACSRIGFERPTPNFKF
ncbi:MAG: hypothetical protein WAO07_11785, partial [Desulfobacterales bacterium]